MCARACVCLYNMWSCDCTLNGRKHSQAACGHSLACTAIRQLVEIEIRKQSLSAQLWISEIEYWIEPVSIFAW